MTVLANLDEDNENSWRVYMDYLIYLFLALQQNSHVKTFNYFSLWFYDDESEHKFYRDFLASLIRINNAINHIVFPIGMGNEA